MMREVRTKCSSSVRKITVLLGSPVYVVLAERRMRSHHFWSVAFLFTTSCAAEDYRVNVARSLRPVDAARAMVVFNQIQGEACGRDAVLGAIRDMKRLEGVDGYIEVLVETRGVGDKRCAKVSAFPFRYGTSTVPPGLVTEYREPMAELIPGATSAPVSPSPEERCSSLCERAANTLEQDSIQRSFVFERCRPRCIRDPALSQCLAAAADAAALRACLETEVDT